MSCASSVTQFLLGRGGANEAYSMELAEEVVSLVARLQAEWPEHDFSLLQSSTDARLMYIEACRQYLEAPQSRAKRNRMHQVWAKLDHDQRWDIEELTFWQTDAHRVKSLDSLASRGEVYPTSQLVIDLAPPKSEPLKRRSRSAQPTTSSRSSSANARPRQRTLLSL
uniref:Uncharacterized protein n=1 Tax=Noctiluca scintillans TaxID=2966 RepID=A0A7S0ZTF5_NOCSC|mmetsp:Transcript_18243/g.49025  ORF Transcript_18243/g.49025 Transcript_18243/m.49025 type:complete len:167 (+) Transcript_18243:35-535(+)